MIRGIFVNIKFFNKFIGKLVFKIIYFLLGQMLDVFEVVELYQKEGILLIILVGKKYGLGNFRDWVVKGLYLLGVKVVLVESYEKIYKDYLIGIGIVLFQFFLGENVDFLGFFGREIFFLIFFEELFFGIILNIQISIGKVFSVIVLFEDDVEIILYKYGGLLNFVV